MEDIKPIPNEQLEAFLVAHNRWHHVDNTLRATFSFADFAEALEFVGVIAAVAEELQHHPVITLDFNKVTVSTNTHDADDQVTERDTGLVRRLESQLEGE